MKHILSIAGSDCSGGAGIQADLKTCEAFGCYGMSAITALTAQNTTGVSAVHPVPVDFLEAQLQAILEDIEIHAIKIGMLLDVPRMKVVQQFLIDHGSGIPIVLDPVAISASGAKLLENDAATMLKSLFALATVLTPNRHELSLFIGCDGDDFASITQSAQRLAEESDTAVIVKNIPLDSQSTDILVTENSVLKYQLPLQKNRNTHGTGCTHSSALACLLAEGRLLPEAAQKAKTYVAAGIKQAPNIGKGCGPIRHHLIKNSWQG